MKKFKADSVKYTTINATAISIPIKALLEKLGLNNSKKNLNNIEVLYDDESDDVIGLQFNFMNTKIEGEIEREVFVKGLFKSKGNRKISLKQKGGVK
jgi:hypothetical protein